MVDPVFTSYYIEERSYVALVKREISLLLKQSGFSEVRVAEINIIVAEFTSNLIKHADQGELLYRVYMEKENPVFEMMCLDKGPGSNDIHRLMEDGVSSSNTLGQGLGAIGRLADVFQIYSRLKSGTSAYVKCYSKKYESKCEQKGRPVFDFGSINVPYTGEVVSGDGFLVKNTKQETQLLIVDALGHGANAHETAKVALKAFERCEETMPGDILRYIHQETKKTRGLVASLAILDRPNRIWKISGVGNISTMLYQKEAKRYSAHNGIVGHNIPRVITHLEVEAFTNDWIVMCSDGMSNRWDLSKYPFIQNYNPYILSSVLYRDYGRRTDDTTVVAAKVNL